MAAGLVHAVTRFCSRGNVSECGCDARLQGPAEAWHWGGCSDHVQYGTWFSRRFLAHAAAANASAGTRAHALLRMNQHNSEAGRQVRSALLLLPLVLLLLVLLLLLESSSQVPGDCFGPDWSGRRWKQPRFFPPPCPAPPRFSSSFFLALGLWFAFFLSLACC